MSATVRLLGSGDAFGSGGRLQPCVLFEAGGARVLIDCGTSVLPAIRRAGISPASIDAAVVTHLHGDHFGGLPFLLLDAVYGDRRATPLTLGGPAGLGGRTLAVLDLLYPGVREKLPGRMDARFVELVAGRAVDVGPASVLAFPARHGGGAQSFSLRVSLGDRVVACSGDTEWTEALLDVARGADLFLCECSAFEAPVAGHLTHRQLAERRNDLDARRVVLTHLGADVLSRLDQVEFEVASDGLLLEL